MLIKDEKEFGSMSMAHVTMGLCTLIAKTLPCMGIVMLTGLVVLMTEKALLEDVSFWEIT
jgi:hypothetical protein